MKQYRFPEKRIWMVLFGLFLLVMLFLARDTLFATAILNVQKAQFLMLGLLCVAGVIFLVMNRGQMKEILWDRRMSVVAFSTIVILVPMLAKQDWQLMYLSILLCLYTAIFLTYFISYKEVARYYVVIITVMGAYSVLANYGLRIFVDSGVFSVPVFENSLGFKFHNFGLSYVSDSYVKNRNFGIYREPGVYQFFILMALYLNNYAVSWKKSGWMWVVNGVLAVTMLSTFATGGVFELGLLAVVMFFDKKWYQDKRIRTITIVLVTAVLAVLLVSIVQKNTLYKELYLMTVHKFADKTSSLTDRMDAIFSDLRAFLNNPLLGGKLAAVLHAVDNNTTSTLLLYAVLGVFGGTLNVAAWIALVWEKNRKIWTNLALLVILFMSFNTENLMADVFFWLFPYMALVERVLPYLKADILRKKA